MRTLDSVYVSGGQAKGWYALLLTENQRVASSDNTTEKYIGTIIDEPSAQHLVNNDSLCISNDRRCFENVVFKRPAHLLGVFTNPQNHNLMHNTYPN